MEQEGVIESINIKLPPEKRIRNINATWDFNYGINLSPETRTLNADATPSTYIAGRLVEGSCGKVYFNSLLRGYLEKRGDIKRTYFDEYFEL